MSKTIPLLSSEQVVAKYNAVLPEKTKASLFSMYNSILGGIVTDPALMLVPLDDHMVHRGHAVFDTANVINGKVYGLDFHIDRFFDSAKKARIDHSYSKESLKQIILDTVAASKLRENIFVRYWLSSGRGDFNIVPCETAEASLFVVVHKKDFKFSIEHGGYNEVTVSIPLKDKLLATMKSTNYLVNVLAALEAGDKKGNLGLQVDPNGNIAECSIGSVGFVGSDGVLRSPKLDRILRSTTLLRAYHFAEKLKAEGVIKDFVFQDVPLNMAKNSVEMIGFGGGYVSALVTLDGIPIGDGKIGPVFMALDKVLQRDMLEGDCLDEIPVYE